MLESELQAGDLIFFMDSQGNPEHVAIYSGFRADTHFITHATTGVYQSIMTTRLKPADPGCHYHVIRFKDLTLGLQTAHRMRVWAEHQVPFSDEKYKLYEAIMDSPGYCHPKTGGDKQCDLSRHYFRPNFYRYIEIASHPQIPYFPHANMEGMRCSEALTTAINVQQLLMMNAVNSCADLQTPWISDRISDTNFQRFINSLPADRQPSNAYRAYLQRSHSPDEYPFARLPANAQLEELPYPPSFIAWNTNKYGDIEHFLETYHHFVLPLDAKITTSWAMFIHVQRDPTNWLDMGTVDIAPVSYPLEKMEANKQAWRDYVVKLFHDAEQKQQSMRSSLDSSRASLAPVISPAKKVKRTGSLEELTAELALLQTDLDHSAADSRAIEEKNERVLKFTSPHRASSAVAAAAAAKEPTSRPGTPARRKLVFQ